MLRFALFGAGRIGSIHAENIYRHKNAELRYVVDVNEDAATALAGQYNATTATEDDVFNDAEIDAVLIASATDTHADLIMKAATAGKAIFCEKPVHLDIAKVEDAVAAVKQAGVTALIGFNRRYDPHFATLKNALENDRIGKVEMVTITSRDPAPPPVDYIKVSGGLFRDMTIHDFDMARWLLDEEITEVFAVGSCQVDPAIGQAGDIDTAMVTLKTRSGKLCNISNSRRASYGYDQRIEVHGEKGMLQAGNVSESTVRCANDAGVRSEKPLHFFLERYQDAYRLELDDFIQATENKTAPRADIFDGLAAQKLAEAAIQSLKTGTPVRLEDNDKEVRAA